MNEFKAKVVVVTGGASGIGQAIVNRFVDLEAKVYMIDVKPNPYYVGDLNSKEDIEKFVNSILIKESKVDYIINNALPLSKGINNCSYEEFLSAQKVGLVAPYYLVKLLKDQLSTNASIINIGSTRAHMSQPQTESYAAAKGGIIALTHALSVSLAGIARVNAISPGWIDTKGYQPSPADKLQHTVHRIGHVNDIVEAVLFLCSSKSGFINGQEIVVDGGMSKQMIYHNDYGWKLEE